MIAPAVSGEHHAYLMSRVDLDSYLEYMTTWPVGAAEMDREQLAKEWQSAHEVARKLRRTESGWADNARVEPMPPFLEPLVQQVNADPYFRQAFAEAPWTIGMVDLQRVVASQLVVNMSLVRRLMDQLGSAPTSDQVFRFCLPFDHQVPSVRAGRIAEREFAFVSESCDLRFLDAVMLRPDQVRDFQSAGPIAGVVGLVVGYGANYLSAVSTHNRLVLINGNHRACTLLALGVNVVPCVVQKIPGPDRIDGMVPSSVRRDKEFYLKNPRPPVLKDYFNTDLVKSIYLAQSAREIRVSYRHESRDVP
jgi:hypothetical protein